MSKKEQHAFSNVLSINPYKGAYVSAVSNFLNETTSATYSKEQYVISYLNTKSFINSHISVSKNIPEEDLYDAIYNKAYDELGLDQAIMYQLQYIETFDALEEENRSFHVFIIDPMVVDDVFKDVVEKVKYVDYILPSPLLYKSLYSKDLIESSGVHCFVYFQENDTFITIYNEKNFIYTKSINYSFLQMHERFCEIYGELVEYEDFINFLSNEDLKTTENIYKSHIIKLYKEIFSNINDILTYVKRALDIEKIECVYIDTQLKSLTKLDEMAEVELSIKSSSFNFDYGFESDDHYVDHFHSLMYIYTTLPQEDKYECNFTTYFRPPSFTKRASGRAILLAAASLVLAFLYPASYWTLTYAQSLQHKLLEDEYKSVHNIKVTREATVKNREADKTKVSTLLAAEENEYIDKKNTLIKIHDVKVNYPMKAELIHRLTKDLNRYSVKIESAFYSEAKESEKSSSLIKELKLGLVSSNDKKITDLIKYLTKVYEGKFHFSIAEISYENESKLYFGELKVSLL
ncbi:MAG: hypothetical protein WCY51_02535 [Sulfurimonas sp.]|uniref:hypothetical protein n=1 Tax=Sulfurimonas sp. TaxID=2022749 RepID=UPI0025D87E0E|nr:hypothetical protein [Sulfurimonas sp.]MCK9454816.1 hypothetical protein [Sulfurimonas sp.]